MHAIPLSFPLNFSARILQALDAEDEENAEEGKPPEPKDVEFETLRLRLSPVRGIEEELIRRIAATEEDESVRLNTLAACGQNPLDSKSKPSKDGKELTVRTTNNWKKIFAGSSQRRGTPEAVRPWWEDPKDPAHLVHKCSEDIITLWKLPRVHEVLRKRKINLEDTSGL